MSIRLRLTIYWALVLSGILIVATVATLQLFEGQQWGELDAALTEEADSTVEELSHSNPDGAVWRLFELSQERDLGEISRVRLVTPEGLLADFGYPDADPPQLKADSHFRGLITTYNKHFRYVVVPFRFNGAPALLEVGVDVTRLLDVVRRLRTILLLTVPFVLLLCVGGGYWLSTRAIAPLEKIATALAAIQPRDLSRRLDAPRVADEAGRLVSVINALLDRLERASATERRFASDAAHELRTPLAVLRSGLEVSLARTRNADESRAALETAHREVISLCKIAEELLMLARLNGEVAIARRPLDLGALIGDVATAVEPLASAKGITLEAHTAGAVVDGNETHLKRVAINLLDNALKFTPEDGHIDISVTREFGTAVLTVADTGRGIESAEMPHIFERFFRGKQATGEGTGLGLNLCQEIVRLHGGTIQVRNRPGGGCEFTVRIPLALPEIRAAAAG